jgi:vacuolar-type H+-ATPase subunit D/Vma8
VLELQESFDKSAEAVISLRQTLNGAIDDYELLKDGNSNLLAERNALRDQVTDLKSELATAKVSSAKDIAALEAKVVSVEAHVVEEVAAGEKRLVDFETELIRDLADLRVM